jgi:RNA-directed DNA polymerase
MKTVRAKIRAATDRRFVGVPTQVVVANLNRVLRGWSAYFRYGNSAWKFEDLDCYVHERLASLTSAKHGQTGWNLGRFDWKWLRDLQVYRLQGKTPLGNCACPAMNDVRKPSAAAPHARFERGPLAKRQPW